MADQRLASTGYERMCMDPSCLVCTLGALPGEDRAAWLARLQARFACRPIPPLPYGLPTRSTRPAVVLVSCPVCSKLMPRGGVCIACVARGRSARQALRPASVAIAAPAPEPPACDVCGHALTPNKVCQSCTNRQTARLFDGRKGSKPLPDGRLVCRRCGTERMPNSVCIGCPGRAQREERRA